jgi:hypothetical protein
MLYNPLGRPDLYDKVDHTQVRYHSGAGVSLTVDPVLQLLWHNHLKAPGAFLIEWHLTHLVNRDMYTTFGLQPFRNSIAAERSVDLWERDADKRSHLQAYLEMRRIMHSPQVFDDYVRTLSGDVVDVSTFWGTRLKNVYADVRREIPKQEWTFSA